MPGETDRIEYKSTFEPDDKVSRLKLVREVVAMANAGGGSIFLGAAEDGKRPGLVEKSVDALDAARLGDLLDEYTNPDRARFEVRTEKSDHPDRSVVEVRIEASGDHPLVFTKEGRAVDASGDQVLVFARHSVYVRRATKAQPATRADIRAWIDRATQRERDDWKARVMLLAKLPPGATLIEAGDDAVLDEPGALLRRAVRTYQRNPEKLLTRQELFELFLARDALPIDEDAFELLVQSAFRRRPTLFFWLAMRTPVADRIQELVMEAIGGSDRDKSDAARALVDVSALYLDAKAYRSVVGELGDSRYAHFREAAEAGPNRQVARRALRAYKLTEYQSRPIEQWTTDELLAEAEDLARSALGSGPGGGAAASRAMSRLGLEYLLRQGQVEL